MMLDNVPVFVVGGLINPENMRAVIKNEEADYISLSRSLIRDSRFPEKIKNGSKDESKCIHCNYCLFYPYPLRCYNGKKYNPAARVTG